MDNNNKTILSTVTPLESLDRIIEDDVTVGQWCLLDLNKTDFYLRVNNWRNEEEIINEDNQVLLCVDSFESNLVVLRGSKQYRVLNKNLGHVLTPINESEATALIQAKAAGQQKLIIETQQEIRDIMAMISMSGATKSDSTEVMVATKNAIMQQSKALKEVHGKRIELLNDRITAQVGGLHATTAYYALPATVGIGTLSKSKDIIEEKLYELNLYGGLSEVETIIAVGGVVHESVPIHIYQNLKHMDVECIKGYASGGIGIKDLKSFHEWLTQPINRDRILPNPKCIVAIKVRKYPEMTDSIWRHTENNTYLYMRNGENIKALKTNLPIGETLLAVEQSLADKEYVKRVGNYGDSDKNFSFMSKNEYDSIKDLAESLKPLYLNMLLNCWREKLAFQKSLLAYAEHRHRLLGDGKVTGFNNNIIDAKYGGIRMSRHADGYSGYHSETQDEFDKSKTRHIEMMADSENAIKAIIDAIKNGFTDPKVDAPTNPSNFSHSAIFLNNSEVGFVALDGTRHLMQYPSSEYNDKIRAYKKSYLEKGLVSPDKYGSNGVFAVLDELAGYELMNDGHYFFDDLKQLSWKRYKRQNDLAVLIQGLLDRSEFFGYTKANLFKAGYEEQIKLVYDKDRGVYNGDMPDFDAFIAKCNQDSVAGDLFYGHQKIWDALQKDKKGDDHRFYDLIQIPCYLAAHKIIKKRDGRTHVVFKWETPREWYSTAKSSHRKHSFECDISKLINVSNYQRGDCDVFTKDPRCRDQYPKWGDLIMSAESYYQKPN